MKNEQQTKNFIINEFKLKYADHMQANDWQDYLNYLNQLNFDDLNNLYAQDFNCSAIVAENKAKKIKLSNTINIIVNLLVILIIFVSTILLFESIFCAIVKENNVNAMNGIIYFVFATSILIPAIYFYLFQIDIKNDFEHLKQKKLVYKFYFAIKISCLICALAFFGLVWYITFFIINIKGINMPLNEFYTLNFSNLSYVCLIIGMISILLNVLNYWIYYLYIKK